MKQTKQKKESQLLWAIEQSSRWLTSEKWVEITESLRKKESSYFCYVLFPLFSSFSLSDRGHSLPLWRNLHGTRMKDTQVLCYNWKLGKCKAKKELYFAFNKRCAENEGNPIKKSKRWSEPRISLFLFLRQKKREKWRKVEEEKLTCQRRKKEKKGRATPNPSHFPISVDMLLLTHSQYFFPGREAREEKNKLVCS